MYLEADLGKVPANKTIYSYTDLASWQTIGTEHGNAF